ncbi:MAG TPA: hypothetical protein VIK02_05540 [Candidatus Anoxymicrobiaceae bacterium]
MEVSENVWNLVNNRADTRGFLATADMEGKCDAACFNSLRLADRHTMTVTLSPNRSLANLKANPRAAFAMTTGESVQDVDGCRVYLLVREIVEGGPVLEEARRTTAERMGKEAAERVQAVVMFDITETRPIIDTGQGV